MDALRSSLHGESPELADQLSEEVREEMDAQQRRMRGRKRNAPAASKVLFPQGVPLLEEEAEEESGLQDQAAPDSPPAIAPLSEQSVTTSLFSDKPGMNEAITVAKLTWKIFRSGKL